jgi:hypothetical protein
MNRSENTNRFSSIPSNRAMISMMERAAMVTKAAENQKRKRAAGEKQL